MIHTEQYNIYMLWSVIIKSAILNPPTLPAKAFQIPLQLAVCSSAPRGNHHPDVSVHSNSDFLWDTKSWERGPPGQGLHFSASCAGRCGHVTEFPPVGRKWKWWGQLPRGGSFTLLLLTLAGWTADGRVGVGEVTLEHKTETEMPARCQRCRAESLGYLHDHNWETLFCFVWVTLILGFLLFVEESYKMNTVHCEQRYNPTYHQHQRHLHWPKKPREWISSLGSCLGHRPSSVSTNGIYVAPTRLH